MSLKIGRLGWFALAKETTPGAPVTPATYFTTLQSVDLNEQHEPIGNTAINGVREKEYSGSVQGKKWGEGSTTVNVDESKVGNLFLALLGSLSTATVAGSIRDHTFSRNNSNTPQTYSLTLDRSTDRKIYTYATAKSGEISFADGLVDMKVDWLSRFPVTTTSGTLTTVSGILFSWKDCNVRFGATIGAAALAAPTQVSEFKLTIDNDSKTSFRSGVQDPASIDHGTFRVFGSFKIFFEDTTQLENYRTLTKQAMEVKITGRGLASGYTESITFNLPQIRLAEAKVDLPADGMVALVCSFEAEYDATTAKMLDIVLRNITASY